MITVIIIDYGDNQMIMGFLKMAPFFKKGAILKKCRHF
jgi:hypothetical protein